MKAVLGVRSAVHISLDGPVARFEISDERARADTATLKAVFALPQSASTKYLVLDGSEFRAVMRCEGHAWAESRDEGLQRGDRLTQLVLSLLALGLDVTAASDPPLNTLLKQWVSRIEGDMPTPSGP